MYFPTTLECVHGNCLLALAVSTRSRTKLKTSSKPKPVAERACSKYCVKRPFGAAELSFATLFGAVANAMYVPRPAALHPVLEFPHGEGVVAHVAFTIALEIDRN